MREVVKAPSMAKFSAVLTPPAFPRLSPVGFFRARRVKPNRPRQLTLFSWCRRKTTAAQSFIKTVRGNSIAVAEILPGLKNLQVDERNLLMALVASAEPPPQNV